MLLAAFFFVGMDTIAKLLGPDYPVPQLLWARFGVHMLVILAFVAATGRKGRRLLTSVAPFGQILRGLLLLGSTSFAYLAVQELPLVQVYIINFTSPLIVTLLAIPLLGERIGGRRVLAICMGFTGVLVALGPHNITTDHALLLPACMALCFAMYQIATRHYGRDDPVLTSLFYTATAGAIVSTLLLPFFWTPIAAEDAWLFVLIGLFGAAGHISLIMAMRLAEASLVSPFLYSQLVWASLAGILIFGYYPAKNAFYGAALLVLAGILIVWSERRRPDLKTLS
ncbi:DMT family transporter [Oceanibium sediminis]|uniref:DMT family transporter n=1 Tax=Oceanibium sediminis TaxID=2026339 RepID=UPI0018E56362|nr:DMT family transporter [Oceanibium sediminis]